MTGLEPTLRLWTALRRDTPLLATAGLLSLLSLLGARIPFLDLDFGLLGFIAGLPLLGRATWEAIAEREVNAESTMLISGVGAVLLAQFSAASIISFMAIVLDTVERVTSWQGSRDLHRLILTTPQTASLFEPDGSVRNVPVRQLSTGDVVLVRQGEIIPVDGKVTEGSAGVVESSLTGEPLPVGKKMGFSVFAGTQLVDGYLKIKLDKIAQESYIQTLVRQVTENVRDRPPIKKFVDAIALYFMPVVLALTVLTYVATQNTIAAVSMLVIASPCAVLSATPLAFLAASAKLARRGVIIKDGERLRKIAQADTVIFDKTGTITFGRPRVKDMRTLSLDGEEKILSIAASSEVPSPHPIAKAIVDEAIKRNIDLLPLEDFRTVVGRGITARIQGQIYHLGQPDWLLEVGVELDGNTTRHLTDLSGDSSVSVILAEGKKPLGLISLKDEVRESARSAVRRLKSMGVKRVLLLTGDRRSSAAEIAADLQIDYMAELKPEEKLRIVRQLEMEGHTVAFVGDGVNDAPAMAASSVALAIAPEGSTFASEVSHVILTRGDLEAIPELIRISRKTLGAVYQNIGLFGVVNGFGMSLAALGLVNPLIGAVLHGLQETLGFVNSSRLAR